jgi:hypothetical protein
MRKKQVTYIALAGTLLVSGWTTATAQCLFSPADVNENVMLEGGDIQGFVDCLVTGATLEGNCACADMDDDGEVDADDMLPFVSALLRGSAFLFFNVESDDDDGTEVNDTVWHTDGYAGSDLNRMGKAPGESNDIGMRFHLQGVQQGDTFVYARLVVPGTADGQVDSTANARIVGIDQTSPPGFDVQRPSELPKTGTSVDWDIGANWPAATKDYDCSPLLRYSPDISPIINEIIGREDWAHASSGETLALVVEDDGSSETNFMTFQDYRVIGGDVCPGAAAPQLELYRTVRSTFLGTELLGRPTDDSITINAYSLLDLDVFIEYGNTPGVYTSATPPAVYTAQTPIEDTITGLTADTTYYYRL